MIAFLRLFQCELRTDPWLKCFFLPSLDKHVPVARFHSTLFCVSVMEGVWSSPFEFPRVPDDEELDGDMSLIGTGGLS